MQLPAQTRKSRGRDAARAVRATARARAPSDGVAAAHRERRTPMEAATALAPIARTRRDIDGLRVPRTHNSRQRSQLLSAAKPQPASCCGEVLDAAIAMIREDTQPQTVMGLTEEEAQLYLAFLSPFVTFWAVGLVEAAERWLTGAASPGELCGEIAKMSGRLLLGLVGGMLLLSFASA